jgi:nucleotide-binding universal stress UspA family protein
MAFRCEVILVALDSSPRAPRIFATAVDLARQFGSRLVLFRAVGLGTAAGLPQEARDAEPEKVPEILEHHAEHDLAAWAREVPPTIPSKVSVHLGVPWQAICNAARDERADLIVLGSHGFGGLDRIIGTTAAKVVNHADRTVLVVREPQEGEGKS